MPPRKTPDLSPKTTAKKPPATGSSTVMDDAPLFAGLEDFVLKQVARKEAGASAAGKPKENKKIGTRQIKPAIPVEPHQTQPAPKVRMAAPTESKAILLSVAEMCSLLRISRATLIRMDNSGKLPGRIKLGGSVRFHRETVETWLKSLIASHPTP